MKNIKFTMNLVWYNCLECPPKESHNDCLFMTDGFNVCEVEYHNSEWFTITSCVEGEWLTITDCIKPIDITENHYWADIKQTVRDDVRFR